MERRRELYSIVATDRATGRRHAVNPGAPIEGRHQAEEQARLMERNNRNLNLHYGIEPWTNTRGSEEELTPESLMTHSFGDQRAWR